MRVDKDGRDLTGCEHCNGRGTYSKDCQYGDGVMALEGDCIFCNGTGVEKIEIPESLKDPKAVFEEIQEKIRQRQLIKKAMKSRRFAGKYMLSDDLPGSY